MRKNILIVLLLSLSLVTAMFNSCGDENFWKNGTEITKVNVTDNTISTEKSNFPYMGGINIFTISTNSAWTIISDQSWCTVQPTSGTGDKEITVSVTQNATGTIRSAILTVTVGNESKQVDIEQGEYIQGGSTNDQSHPMGTVVPNSTATDVTNYGRADGKITNIDSRYSIQIGTDINFIESTVIVDKSGSYGNLTAGTYYVRYASYTGYLAGQVEQTLVITQPAAPPTGTRTHPKEGTNPNVSEQDESAYGKGDGSITNLDPTYSIEVSEDPTFSDGTSVIIAPNSTKTLGCKNWYIRWAGTSQYKPSTTRIDIGIGSKLINPHPKDSVEPDVTVTNETTAGSGGSIKNNDTQYDIEIATNLAFTLNYYRIVAGHTQTGIPAGTYFIRYAAFGDLQAGRKIIVVTISSQ